MHAPAHDATDQCTLFLATLVGLRIQPHGILTTEVPPCRRVAIASIHNPVRSADAVHV